MNLSIQKYILTISIVLALITISACSKQCKAGYEGSRCNVLTITKFEGTWSAVDSLANLAYTDTITKGIAINDVVISVSFANHHFNSPVNASVLGSIITIPYQQPDADSVFVQGTGTLSTDNNHITFNYQFITAVDSPANYTGTWTRIN